MFRTEQQNRNLLAINVAALDSSKFAGRQRVERQVFSVVDNSTGDYVFFEYTNPSSGTSDPALTASAAMKVSNLYVAILDSFAPEIAAMPAEASETSPAADLRRKIEEVKSLISSGMIGRARKRFSEIPSTWSTKTTLAELGKVLETAVAESDAEATGRPINRQFSNSIKDRYGDAWVATKENEVVQTSASYSELKQKLRQEFADLTGIRIMRVG